MFFFFNLILNAIFFHILDALIVFNNFFTCFKFFDSMKKAKIFGFLLNTKKNFLK